MIYFYKIRVQFGEGKQAFTKEYTVDFLHVAQIIMHLEEKHKNNYTIISIKERKSFYDKERYLQIKD